MESPASVRELDTSLSILEAATLPIRTHLLWRYSCWLVVGGVEASPRSLNFESERFSVYLDDQLEAEALAMEIMGGPLKSLRWLVSELSKRDKALEAGALVIQDLPRHSPIPPKERCQLR